jgi:predicted alpha/beta superfamily hydrolase
MTTKSFLFALSVVLVISCQKRKPDNSIAIGERDSIQSEILKESRPYLVYLPPGAKDPSKKFPVLYLLDGDAHFQSVSALIQILGTGVNGTNVMPEMIVVAIPNTDRTRDLTPTHSEMVNGEKTGSFKNSGGGPHFLRFIRDELIPRIESNYRTNSYRMLIGHSFGGITVINALYTMPEIFDAYISIDPSLWWDEKILLRKADSIFTNRSYLGKYLFISQANTLNPGESTNWHFGAIKEYVKVLESHSNSGLQWSYKYYPSDSHGSVPMISEYDGLRFIFEDFEPSFEKIGRDPNLVVKNFEKYHQLPSEGTVNRFGYTAVAIGDLDLAQRYFQMNIDSYPQSANAYDSMGELWMTRGDTTKAISNYKKSIELDPTNNNARGRIAKMRGKNAS